MIYIRLEMWPGGDREKARLLGEGTITNVGGDSHHADYRVELLKSPEYARAGNVGKVWRAGVVSGFERTSAFQGPWDLLLRGLLVAIGKRNRGAIQSALTGRSIGALLLSVVSSVEPLKRELRDLAAGAQAIGQHAQVEARVVNEDPQVLIRVPVVLLDADGAAAVREDDRLGSHAREGTP